MVTDEVMLLSCHAVVMMTWRIVQMPIAERPTTQLSDRHTVISVADPETRRVEDARTAAMLPPTTVTLTAPDTAALIILTLLGAAASMDIEAVKLLICQPEVRTVRRWGHTAIGALDTRALSDCHNDISDVDPPTRSVPEYRDAPTLRPTTVTEAAPVAGTLAIETALGAAASIVIAAVKLFTCQPVVIATTRRGHMLADPRDTMQVADCHAVASDVEPPVRDVTVYCDVPTWTPTTVTLNAPVDAMLAICTLLGAPASIVNDAVKLFVCQPVVITTRRCGHTLADVRATMELSDRQCVI